MNTFVDLIRNITGTKRVNGVAEKFLSDYKRVLFYDVPEKAQKNRNVSHREYEAGWKKIKDKKIKVYGLFGMHAIGECVPRFFDILEDGCKNDEFKIFIPYFNKVYQGNFYNDTLLKMMEREIHLVNRENFGFWEYVFKKYGDKMDCSQFNKYNARRAGNHPNKIGRSILPFTDEEKAEGERQMEKMGLTKPFVCIHARGKNLKKIAYGNETVQDESDYRSCDIDTFEKACSHIYEEGMEIVRMGKFEKTPCRIDHLIDYSNHYWNGLMDFYLLHKCKYILGSESGLSLIAPFWGCPALITNFTEFSCTNEALPNTGMEMYIPKKQWSIREKRYLNLYEMFDASNRSMGFMSNFMKDGIIFEDNTEDEILETVKEFEARLEGNWIEDEDEQDMMKKYYQIVDKWKNSHSWTYLRRRMRVKTYTPVFYRPSYVYLKNNSYLLDVEL